VVTMLEKIANIAVKRPWTVILIVLLLTAIFASALPKARFETEMEQFFPESDVVKASLRIKEYFGTEPYTHIIYIEGENVLNTTALREEYRLSCMLRGIKGVVSTESIADIFNTLCKYEYDPFQGELVFNENKTLLNARDDEIEARKDIMRRVLQGNTTFIPINTTFDPDEIKAVLSLLLSEDFDYDNMTATAALLIVRIDGNLSRAVARGVVGKIHDAVERFLQSATYPLHIMETSDLEMAYEVEKNLPKTGAFLAIGIIVLISLILLATFRRPSYILFPLITLFIAIIWTFGTMILLGTVFTVMEVAVIPLIMGLGIDYFVHVSRRYQEELRKGAAMYPSMKTSIVHVGLALFLAVVTTVIAFMSNIFSLIPPIRDFGITCALGVLYSFVLALVFYPSMRIISDKRALSRGRRIAPSKAPASTLFMAKIFRAAYRGRYAILAVVIAATLLSVILLPALRVEFDVKEFMPRDWESMRATEMIEENFAVGTYTYSYILIEGNVATLDAYTKICELCDKLKDNTYLVKVGNDTAQSVVSVVRLAIMFNRSIMLDFKLDERGAPLPNCTDEDIESLYDYLANNNTKIGIGRNSVGEMFKRFVHMSGGVYDATIVYLPVKVMTIAKIEELRKELETDISGISWNDYTVTVTGGVLLIEEVMLEIQKSQIKSTAASLAAVAVVLIIIYRRPSIALISLLPVILTMFWVLGTMAILSIPLNVLTIMVSALTIGLGIDYAIHVIERYKEERKERTPMVAMENTLSCTGSALLISAITTIAGFGILIMAEIPLLRQFGIVTATMIAYSLLSAVIVLPIPLLLYARIRKY